MVCGHNHSVSSENSYAYRPRKRAQQAIDAIKEALLSGRREVVDADLSGYFDTSV
jgi:retron-type reverse transcriptase